MATIHRRKSDLVGDGDGDGDDTAMIHRGATNRKIPTGGPLAPRIRRGRGRGRSSSYRGFQTIAIKGFLILVLAWMMGFFAVYSGFFGSITMPTATERILPVSPYFSKFSKQMPNITNSTNSTTITTDGTIHNDIHHDIHNPTHIKHDAIHHANHNNTTDQNQNPTHVHHTNANEHHNKVHHTTNNEGYESPLLIFTCKRASYLKETLENVYATISQPCGFGCPIIVSEDGEHESIRDLLLSFKEKFEAKGIPLIHIHHKQKKLLKGEGNAYNTLAKHYGWALSQVFDGTAIAINNKAQEHQQQHPVPQRVVILEEDIKVAPDFFSYMESTSSILDSDPTLFAVSAFNDNGHLENGDPKRLLRSDFFPGLGWMMTRDLWKNELESKWPDGYWDDWLRLVEQRRDRQVIRPEVSRTYHFGKNGGASSNQFGSILERVKLNEKDIRWGMEDISYLDNSLYENQYSELVMSSKLVNTIEEAKHNVPVDFNERIEYDGFSHFGRLAKELGIMDDEKALVPRTAYRGIVEVRQGSSLLFLTPKGGFESYKKEPKKVVKHITKHITQAKESFFKIFNFKK